MDDSPVNEERSKSQMMGGVVSDHVDKSMLHSTADYESLSLYEKKCMVVNREIDRMGMGKYQWWIWGLCGFGYLLDLMWAQAFGLILQPLEQEFDFPRVFSSRHDIILTTD